jgi:biotin carboxyl carrier protein
MEIPVVAPISGTVKEIKVAVGDAVESDTVLAVIE